MKTINDHFQKVYVITCESLNDRHSHIRNHFQKFNVSFEFCVSHHFSHFTSGPVSPSMKSLISGHIKCVSDAKSHGYKEILICEDDVEFIDGVGTKLSEFMLSVDPSWKFLQLGNQFWAKQFLRRIKIKENLYEFQWGTGSHCIAIKNDVYDSCIEEFSKYDDVIDFIYYRLFSKYKAYCPENFLANALSSNDHLGVFDNKQRFPSKVVHGYHV